MGNEASIVGKNLDKRTARREHKENFSNAIQKFRSTVEKSSAPSEKDSEIFQKWNDSSIRVFARKRPIFQHEIDAGEFDVISCHGNQKITIHDCRMHADMRKQIINHHEFEFDYAFGESANNQMVYETTTRPLVKIACEGGFSTAMVYGQTGSGKVRVVLYEFN
jgi:kinesin family protein 2/24